MKKKRRKNNLTAVTIREPVATPRKREKEMRKKTMLSVGYDERIGASWLKRSVRTESCLSVDRPILFVIVFPFGSVDRRYADRFFSGLHVLGTVTARVHASLQVKWWIWCSKRSRYHCTGLELAAWSRSATIQNAFLRPDGERSLGNAASWSAETKVGTIEQLANDSWRRVLNLNLG